MVYVPQYVVNIRKPNTCIEFIMFTKILFLFQHISDIAALHQLSLSASTARPLVLEPTSIENTAAQGFYTNDCTCVSPCVSNKILQSDILMSKANTTKYNDPSSCFLLQRSQSKEDNMSQPLVPYAVNTLESYRQFTVCDSSVMVAQSCCTETDFGTFSRPPKEWAWLENGLEAHLHKSACLQDNTVNGPFSTGQHSLLHKSSNLPNPFYKSNDLSFNRESFYTELSSEQNSTNPSYCANEITDVISISQPLPLENQRGPLKQTQGTFYNHLFTTNSNEDTDDCFYSQKVIVGKRKLTVNSVKTKEGMSTGTECLSINSF